MRLIRAFGNVLSGIKGMINQNDATLILFQEHERGAPETAVRSK
jgi:hypothetical protein